MRLLIAILPGGERVRKRVHRGPIFFIGQAKGI
jgi:hypothetical protein